jgi:diguanylate cyclase (GGDEF)-like protein/PAS domain S-box-containing protein
LTAFAQGGVVTGAAGDNIFVEKLGGQTINVIIKKADDAWQPLLLKLDGLLLDRQYQQSQTLALIELMSVSNLKLLELMNDLTIRLEKDAKQKTYILRGLQTAIVVLILLAFIIATVRFYRKEKYYNHLMEKSTDIVIGIDVVTAVTTFVSNSVATVLGNDTEYYYEKPASLFFEDQSAAILADILEYSRRSGKLEKDRCEVTMLKSDGSFMIADMVMQLSQSEDGRHMELGVDIRDISERKKAEIALSELAYKDLLTNLPNRRLFYELAERSLSLAKRNNNKIAIMFIDLDGFKAVNDNYGHEIGDKVLVEVGRRLKSCLRASDVVARLGGDEFTVVVEDVQNNKDLEILGQKIIHNVSTKILISSHQIQLGVSIGVAIYPENGADINLLVKHADSAMYKVKETGKNNIVFAG